jgi:hypothetical protein
MNPNASSVCTSSFDYSTDFGRTASGERGVRIAAARLRRVIVQSAPGGASSCGAAVLCVRSRRTRGVNLGEATDFAGDTQQVVGGVNGLLDGVQLVEHSADEGGDRRAAAVAESDRRRVQRHIRITSVWWGNGLGERPASLDISSLTYGSVGAVAVANTPSVQVRRSRE